jgi:type III restriction enzyme
MKFTLKDYQDDAVRAVLKNLRKARRDWQGDKDKCAFSLTAPTGAGKTVMAAAAFEALFHGDDNHSFDADPGAVVIWFSDDPSLNEQTRHRLIESSDRIRSTDLRVVDNTFGRERFEAGKIYFLNTQKLSKNSLLVRGFEPSEGGQIDAVTRPDDRAYTIWDTIKNTIEDPELTLYLMLDEAHRGMGQQSRAQAAEKSTIVTRLINGAGGVPGIPVVLGISATVERFTKAMADAQGRTTLPDVKVDATRVQESGLLKDTIILDIPNEAGPFETVLLRRATEKLKDSHEAWTDYAKEQDEKEPVVPLMVLQVPNTPDADEVGKWLDTIFQAWPDLPSDSVAHVFGDHTAQTFGNRTVPYIEPQRVQSSTWCRILIAKDAISTGWDCPRAEVMMSFRSAQDPTHITQLLGRMVRTPLARRIPGNDRLNSVDCLLPHFDKKAVEAVADALMKGGGEGGESPIQRVLINPKEMKPNPTVPEALWEKFLALPSQTRPQLGAKPAKRLTALAHELAEDELLKDAGKMAHAALHTVLDAAQVRYAKEISAARDSVMQVEGTTLRADLKGKSKSLNQFLEDADMAVIDDAFKRAARVFSPDIARTYVPHVAAKKINADANDPEDAYVEARADIAALGLVQDISKDFDREADKLATAWLHKYRIDIKDLSDERQDAYRQVTEMSTEPQDVDLVKPISWIENTTVRESGKEAPIPTYKNHLMSDESGDFPALFRSDWEIKVLATESARKGFTAWYRNPDRSSQDSLGIAYQDAETVKIVRPDFLFFSTPAIGKVVADIVDPHGTQFADALPKLRGLVKYAETHVGTYRRIEAVAAVGGQLKALDLTNPKIQAAVKDADDAVALYGGDLAVDYR